MKTSLWLDLTPWVRGPQTGIGRSAYGTFRALEASLKKEPSLAEQFTLEGVERGRSLSGLRAWWGRPHTILHTFDHKMPRFGRGLRLVTFHDAWTLWPNEYQDEKFRTRQAPKLRAALARADAVVTPTAAVASDLRRCCPELKAFVTDVPWGWSGLESVAPALPSSFVLPARPFVAFVGVVEPRKNPTYAIDALAAAFPELEFVVVGKAGYRGEEIFADLRARFGARLHTVASLGEEPRRELYRRAAAVILPSRDEGFGLVSIEAGAEGARLLLSDIPPFREILPDSRRFSLEDAGRSLVEAFRDLIADPDGTRAYAERIRVASRAYVWERTAAGYWKVYERLRQSLR